MERFKDVATDLVIQSGMGIHDDVGTLGDIVGGYAGGRAVRTSDGLIDFSGTAAQQLFRLVGLDVKTMNYFNDHPEVQQAMMAAKLADSQRADEKIVARGVMKDGGLMYQAFLTQDHLPVLNSHVIGALQNALPETTLVHKGSVSNRKLNLRLTDENWYHDIGNGDRALTAIVVENDERGQGGLSIRTGITRVACWNYTLNHQPVFQHSSGFLLPDRLNQGIEQAVGRLDEVANAITERMLAFHDVTVDDVTTMLKVMSGEMGLPDYATKAAEDWWAQAGSINSLFWVVQALSFAAGSMTEGKRRQWSRRETVEYQAYHMADDFAQTGVLSLHECPKCHRPMSVLDDDAIEGEYEIG